MMGLFDFMKKDSSKEKSNDKTKEVNPASLESYTIKVENDQIPFHDCGVNMDVKLLVRAEFIFKGVKPDEKAVTEAAIESIKYAFSQIEGKASANEFTKSPNMNFLKTTMRENMNSKGFEVWSVMINWMSYNKEYKEIINPKI